MSDILEAIKNGNLIFMRATHSVAVVNHIFSARRHWSWAEREKTTKEGGATTRDVQLQLKVATIFEREGGPPTDVTSTAALQCMFGVDDVRSGTVLLRDLNSATFHLQTAAEAFADLGKLLGVDHGNVASYRHPSLAFGAPGRSNAQWGGEARAHHEAVQRVFKFTKKARRRGVST